MKLYHLPLLVLLLVSSFVVSPQVASAQEVQVAFDSQDDLTGSVYEIDRELRDQLGLFPDYPDFESARIYKTSVGSYSLEVTFIDGGRSTRKVTTLDSAATAALRADVRSKITTERPLSLVDQSGRSHFLWTTAFASFLYYGPALTFALGAEDAAVGSTTYLLSAGAGFFIPYLITQNSRMTDGMAAGARVGSILGVAHSLLLFGAADVFENDDDNIAQTFAGVSTLMSVAEMSAGIALADHYNISDGRMNLIGVGGVFGASNGQFVGALLLGEEASLPLVAGLSLAGSLAGMYGANTMALKTNYTTGDAKAMMMGGLLGYFVAGSLLAATEADFDIHVFSGLMLGANAAGLYATHKLLGNRDLRDVEGNYTIIGTIAGGLLGAGIAIAGDMDGTEAILVPALGATAGFAVMMGTVGKSRGDRGELDLEPQPFYGANEIDGSGSMSFNFNPAGLVMAAAKYDLGSSLAKPINVPVAGVSVRL